MIEQTPWQLVRRRYSSWFDGDIRQQRRQEEGKPTYVTHWKALAGCFGLQFTPDMWTGPGRVTPGISGQGSEGAASRWQRGCAVDNFIKFLSSRSSFGYPGPTTQIRHQVVDSYTFSNFQIARTLARAQLQHQIANSYTPSNFQIARTLARAQIQHQIADKDTLSKRI